MDAPPEATIGTGDHVFTTDNLRKSDDSIGDQFRMFHDVGCMADNAGDQKFAVRKLNVLPDLPFVLVTSIACLDRVSLRIHPAAIDPQSA